ncbi:MAG: T9SS type A sorting domain-containing protein [Chitinophagales bacterium]|nr:T9SS type A sorting domain-containing protein [Chitinophagales bacterium]
MKNFFLFLLILPFIFNNGLAQVPSIAWQKTFGGSGNDIMQDIYPTSDGNYIMLGLTSANDGDVNCETKGKHDTWVVKMDPAGTILWQHCYGGTKEEGNPNSKIIQTSDGGYLFETETWSNDVDVVGHHDLSDAWTVKLDSIGNIQWSRSYGGYNWDVPRNILELPGHQYLIMSRSTSSDGDVPPSIDSSDFDAWIFIVDSIGNILTNKIYGGTGNDDLYTAIFNSDGNLSLFGLTSSNDGDLAGMNVDSTEGWMLKIDLSGNILSNHVYGGAYTQSFLDAITTEDAGYLAVGESNNPAPVNFGSYHGEADFWAVKLDSIGNIQWQGLYGGSANETFRRVKKAFGTKGYFLAGTSTSIDGDVSAPNPRIGRNYWIAEINSEGTFDWGLALGGSQADYCYSITEDGICVGGTYSNDGDITDLDGDADGWVVQLSYPTAIHLNSELLNQVKIFPVPAQNIITVQSAERSNESTITVTNVCGKTIFSKRLSSGQVQIDVSKWPAGIYYLSSSDSFGKQYSVSHFEIIR